MTTSDSAKQKSETIVNTMTKSVELNEMDEDHSHDNHDNHGDYDDSPTDFDQ